MAASHTRTRVAPNLYQRGDGRFVAGVTIDGKWCMPTLAARTKRAARVELARLQMQAAERKAGGEQIAPPVLTVADVARLFIRHFEALVSSGERSPRTLDHYAWVLRAYLLPAWGERDITGIRPADIVTLSGELRERERGPSVVRAVEDTASRLFSFAVRRDYLETSPMTKLERGERAKVASDDRRVLSHDEIARLLATTRNLFERALLAVLLYAGLRQGELLGLQWRDIDHTQGLIRVRRQLQRPRRGQLATLAPVKMHSERDVVLAPQLAALLAEHRLASSNSGENDFVFARLDGSPLHYSRMNRILKRITTAAGVDKVSAPVFRRTYASHLIIDLGLDAVRVQRQLGHSRTSVTLDRYAFLFEQARHADELRSRIATSPYAALLSADLKQANA